MLELPRTPRRVDMRAYVLTMGMLSTVVIGLIARAFDRPQPAAWALAAGMAVVVIGLGSKRAASAMYVWWNRAARSVSRLVRLWITTVAFFVMAVVGSAGSRLPWRMPRGPRSGWIERGSPSPAAFTSQGWEPARDSGARHWTASLASWGFKGNGWIWGLVPFLLLIGWIDGGEVHAPTDRNYTLY